MYSLPLIGGYYTALSGWVLDADTLLIFEIICFTSLRGPEFESSAMWFSRDSDTSCTLPHQILKAHI